MATNALLEVKGAKIGLITSTGFRDVHKIRRQNREDLFALEPKSFPSLVTEDRVYEIEIRHERGPYSQPQARHFFKAFLDGLPR